MSPASSPTISVFGKDVPKSYFSYQSANAATEEALEKKIDYQGNDHSLEESNDTSQPPSDVEAVSAGDVELSDVKEV